MIPVALLKKIYRPDNASWDAARGMSVHAVPDDFTPAQVTLLEEQDLVPGSLETLTHDTGIKAFVTLQSEPSFTLSHAARLFLDALGGGPLIGLSAVMIHLHARALIPHAFSGEHHCTQCGFPPNWTHDRTQEVFTAALGHSGNELLYRHLPVAQRHLSMSPDAPDKGRAVLEDLIALVAEAPPEETPSKLQARVARAKLLPVRDKYAQHGILQTLAECGILPQSAMPPAIDAVTPQSKLWEISRNVPGSSRSDITLPLAAWRGSNGVDRDRLADLLAAASA